MKFQIFAISAALITLTSMCLLIRRGRLKEKYTLIWVLAAFGTLLVATFPSVLDQSADLLGINQGPNLLFLLADLGIMLICVQLSIEASTQAAKTRTLAEELGILRLEVERQARLVDTLSGSRHLTQSDGK